MIRSAFAVCTGLACVQVAISAAEPQGVHLIAVDSIHAEGPLAFDAFVLPDLDPVYAELDEQGGAKLEPGQYVLVAKHVPGVSAEITVINAPTDARVDVERSVWLKFVAPQPDRDGQAQPDREVRALLALRPARKIREIQELSRAWLEIRPTDDVLALPRPGCGPESVASALALAREVIAKEFKEPKIEPGQWPQRYHSLLSAGRILTTYGDQSDVQSIFSALSAAAPNHPMQHMLLTILADIEARLGHLHDGLTRRLIDVPHLSLPTELALADLGDPRAEESIASGARTSGAPALGVATGPYTPAAVKWARGLIAEGRPKKTMRSAYYSGTLAAATLILLSAGDESDLTLLAAEPLSVGLLQRLADASRAPLELARAAARLRMTYLTYRMAQSSRTDGESRAPVVMDQISLCVGGESAELAGAGEAADDRIEYRWIRAVASAWTPTDTALECVAKNWIHPDKPEAYIHSNFPWLAAPGAAARTAGWLAQGKYEWRDFSDQATPEEYEKAGKDTAADQLIPNWPLHLAAARVTTRACMPPPDEFPLGITRVPYVIRVDEGAIVGVASLRPSWRESTLRLAVRLEQIASYAGGGLIDFHQGDIRSYDHFVAATRPWSALAGPTVLLRGREPVSIREVGLDDGGWMVFEADLGGRDLSDLWCVLPLKHKNSTQTLVFDLPRSDFARLQRRAESKAGGSPDGPAMLRAAAQLASGYNSTAITTLTRELEQAKPAAVDLVLSALEASGDHARAAELLERLSAKTPAWRIEAALARYRAGQFELALAHANEAASAAPTDVRAAWLRARLLVLLKRDAEAAAALTSPPLAQEDAPELRVLRHAELARLPAQLKGTAREDAEKASLAESRALEEYAKSLPEDTPERRLWQDVTNAWASADADRDATTPAEVCVFSAYRGYAFLAGRRTDLAQNLFQAAVDTRCVTLPEYQLAKVELARLKDTHP